MIHRHPPKELPKGTAQMKIVALVLAGGEGTRLYPLTAEHAKPALPFANGYRICDFVLSNLVNSSISTIYVLAQYKPQSLMKHIPGHPRLPYPPMGNYLFEPQVLERVLQEARKLGEVDFGRDVLPRVCQASRVYAYDFAENAVPGVQDYEERAYWRDVGTLSALAAAQQDAMGPRPRFNLWNSRWPIRGEYDAVMLERTRALLDEGSDEQRDVKAPASWRGARRDRHTDERVPTS